MRAATVVWSALDDPAHDAIQGPAVLIVGPDADPDFPRVEALARRHVGEALECLGDAASDLTGGEIVRQLVEQFSACMDDGRTYTPSRLESHAAVYRRAAAWGVELSTGKRVDHAIGA
jgi:hypothetical protein